MSNYLATDTHILTDTLHSQYIHYKCNNSRHLLTWQCRWCFSGQMPQNSVLHPPDWCRRPQLSGHSPGSWWKGKRDSFQEHEIQTGLSNSVTPFSHAECIRSLSTFIKFIITVMNNWDDSIHSSSAESSSTITAWTGITTPCELLYHKKSKTFRANIKGGAGLQ